MCDESVFLSGRSVAAALTRRKMLFHSKPITPAGAEAAGFKHRA